MIKDIIGGKLLEAMKAKDTNRVMALREIKTVLTTWPSKEENVGKPYTDAVELNLITKVAKMFEESAKTINDGKHDEDVKNNLERAAVVKEFLPAEVGEDKIIEAFQTIACNVEKTMKNMGVFVKEIKAVYPTADGKLIADVVKAGIAGKYDI